MRAGSWAGRWASAGPSPFLCFPLAPRRVRREDGAEMSTSLPRSPRRFARPVAALAVLGAAVGASVWSKLRPALRHRSADLSVTVSHDPDSPLSGEPVTFTLTASNAGPDAAATVVAGLSFGYPFSYTAVPSTTSPACRIAQSQPALIYTLGTLAHAVRRPRSR